MPAPNLRAVVTSLALVAGASLFAIASTSPAQSVEAAETAAATAPVPVSISKRRVITMPTTIQPGVNQFDVTTAARQSGFQLVLPAPGYTTKEAVRDIVKGFDLGKIQALKRFEANVTLYGGVVGVSGEPISMVVSLPAGTYWATDTRTNNDAKFTVFTVAGADTGNVAPPADNTITAKGTSKWRNSPASIDRKGMLTFTNASEQNHFISMVRLKKGKDLQDFKDWFLVDGPPSGPSPADFSVGLDSSIISPGVSMAFDYKLPRGNYVVLCFWPDASMGGMDHASMGMIRGIRLT